MKTTIKLAAAVALVVSSGAQAVNLVPPGNGTSGSSLVLTAFDTTSTFLLNDGVTVESARRGLVVDLGVDLAGFLSDPAGSISPIDVTPLFNQAFVNVLDGDGEQAPSNPANIRWNITAGNFGPGNPDNKLLTSTAQGTLPAGVENGQLSQGVFELLQFMNAVNNVDPTAAFTTGGNGQSGDPNPATNHGSNFNAQLGTINNTVGLGEAIDLVLLSITTDFVFGVPSIVPGNPVAVSAPFDLGQTQTQFWTLTEDGQLAFVPLPAGVWLLGSALLGLAGVARRRAA